MKSEQLRDTLKVRRASEPNFSASYPFGWLMTIQIFKDVPLYFSHSMHTLAVIPAMDHIDETLTSQSLNSDYEPAIHTALRLAKKVLNRYYSATDHSEVYRIVMGTYFTL